MADWIVFQMDQTAFENRSLLGLFGNAVKTQICIALCAFLLVAIMKNQLNIGRNLYEILQILSLSQFEKTPVNIMFSETGLQNFNEQDKKQLTLFNF